MSDAGTLIGTVTFPLGVGGESEIEAKRLFESQVPYENFAGKLQNLDADVLGFVKSIRTGFKQRMMDVIQRWKTNWWVANGNSANAEFEDDIHVPETWKMLESTIPRIEEAMLEFDPFLEVEGVNTVFDRLKALTIASYVRRQLERARFRDYIRPTIKDSLLCQVAAIKVIWERIVEDQVDRKTEVKWNTDGTSTQTDTRHLVRRVVKNGASLWQVDPFRLLIDLDAGQVKDVTFIGDESSALIHELERDAGDPKTSLYSKTQVKKVADRTRRPADDDADDFFDAARSARSVTHSKLQEAVKSNDREAARCRRLNLYCYYDFKQGYDGVTNPVGEKLTGVHKVVITIAEGVLIEFRLNPFDKKFFPYGVARLNCNGHEMYGVGPYDNMVVVNAQYDQFQSSVMRQQMLSVTPLVVRPPGQSTLPENLLGVRVGTVFEGAGDLQIIKPPDLGPMVPYIHKWFRTEGEEVTGAPRIWEGTGPSGSTFGESERKLQEANRRLRGYIRSYADMWRQVALIIYWMSGQFATKTERFQVVGKAAQILDREAEITPDMMQEDIDVRFIGLDSLHTYGNKGSGMQQWTAAWGPSLPNYPEVNTLELMQRHWEHVVGKDSVDSIFSVPTPRYMLMSQEDENLHLMRGMRVRVDQQDDDARHMSKMVSDGLMDLAMDKKTAPHSRKAIFEHFQEHYENHARKQEQQAADQERAEQKAMLMGQTGGIPQQGGAPVPGGMPAATKNVTPGPGSAQQTPRMGRSGNGIAQADMLRSA